MDIDEKIADVISLQSATCVRGVSSIAIDRKTDKPIGALAIVAPRCVVFCQPLQPERDIFIDVCLN